jgi:hypothetical protein
MDWHFVWLIRATHDVGLKFAVPTIAGRELVLLGGHQL